MLTIRPYYLNFVFNFDKPQPRQQDTENHLEAAGSEPASPKTETSQIQMPSWKCRPPRHGVHKITTLSEHQLLSVLINLQPTSQECTTEYAPLPDTRTLTQCLPYLTIYLTLNVRAPTFCLIKVTLYSS